MKKLIKLVESNYMATKEELKQEYKVLEIMKKLFESLNQEQSDQLLNYLTERDKLEKIVIDNYIVTTQKICKEVFKLR